MSGSRANPYPGTRAFEAEDSGRFFGRATEIRQLRDLAVARRVVLLYAASGAGKTSLLTAGLVPHLRQTLPGARVFPVARVSGDPPAGLEVADARVWNILNAILEEGIEPAEIARLTLCQGLDKLLAGEAPEEGPPPAFLILDQLEELFQDGRGDPRIFFLQLREVLEVRPELSLILALREDALAQLDPCKVLLPDQLRTRIRLELLGPEAALCAIEGPARDAGVPFAPGAARQLVDDLRRSLAESPEGAAREELGAWVDPVQLQVVCHRIWAGLPEGATEIDEARAHAVGSFDEILARHYDERLRDMERETGVPEKTLRRWIDQLITPQGLRSQVPQEPGVTRGLDNRAVKALVDTHLVRAERRRGMVWYELGHDRMVRPVRQSNERWREANRSLLERQVDLWVLEGRPLRRLLEARELAAAEQRVAAGEDEETPEIREFLEACRKRQRKVRGRWRALFAGALLGVAALTVFFIAMILLFLAAVIVASLDLENEILRNRGSNLDLALLYALTAQELQQKFGFESNLTDPRRPLFLGLSASPALETFLSVPAGKIECLAFSPDGRRLVAGTSAGTLAAWHAATREPLPLPWSTTAAGIRSLTFSADSRLLAVAAGDALFLGPPGSPLERLDIPGAGGFASVRFSPTAPLLALLETSGAVRLWDAAAGRSTHRLPSDPARAWTSLAFSPDGGLLATGRADGAVQLWQVESGTPLGSPRAVHAAAVTSLAFHPEGTVLASGSADGMLLLLPLREDGSPAPPPRPAGILAIRELAFSPDGKLLAAGGASGKIALWDARQALPLGEPLTGKIAPLAGLSFSVDGRTLASGNGSTVVLWKPAAGPRFGQISPAPVQELRLAAFDPRGGALAFQARQPESPPVVRIWDMTRDRPRAGRGGGPWTLPAGDLSSLALGPGARALATAGTGGDVRLWNLRAQEPPAVLHTGHSIGPVRLSFSPFRPRLATAGTDGKLHVWDTSTRKVLLTVDVCAGRAVESVALGHRGHLLAAGCSNGIVHLVSTDGQKIAWRETVTLPDLPVQQLALSPDEKTVAAATADGSLWLINLQWKSLGIGPLLGHQGPVAALAFPRPDTIVSAGTDNRLIRWDLEPESWRDLACGIVRRDMTKEELDRLPFSMLVSRATCVSERPEAETQ